MTKERKPTRKNVFLLGLSTLGLGAFSFALLQGPQTAQATCYTGSQAEKCGSCVVEDGAEDCNMVDVYTEPDSNGHVEDTGNDKCGVTGSGCGWAPWEW